MVPKGGEAGNRLVPRRGRRERGRRSPGRRRVRSRGSWRAVPGACCAWALRSPAGTRRRSRPTSGTKSTDGRREARRRRRADDVRLRPPARRLPTSGPDGHDLPGGTRSRRRSDAPPELPRRRALGRGERGVPAPAPLVRAPVRDRPARRPLSRAAPGSADHLHLHYGSKRCSSSSAERPPSAPRTERSNSHRARSSTSPKGRTGCMHSPTRPTSRAPARHLDQALSRRGRLPGARGRLGGHAPSRAPVPDGGDEGSSPASSCPRRVSAPAGPDGGGVRQSGPGGSVRGAGRRSRGRGAGERRCAGRYPGRPCPDAAASSGTTPPRPTRSG